MEEAYFFLFINDHFDAWTRQDKFHLTVQFTHVEMFYIMILMIF